MRGLGVCFLIITFTADSASAGKREAVKPSKKDKCPVCGMFVYKYPDWTAEIIYNDGTHVFFDGAKDMFKYLFNLNTYLPSKEIADINTIYVTEYYDLEFVEARKAYYVIGSNVLGPMGKELVPFKSEADAIQFKKDHRGKEIINFKKITAAVIQGLN